MKNVFEKVVIFGGLGYFLTRDGIFGACTQKAALTAFPNNWEKDTDFPDARSIKDRLIYINSILKGQPLDKIKLMLPKL